MLYFILSCGQIALFLDMLRRLPAVSAAVLCSAYVMVMQVYFVYRAATFSRTSFSVGSLGSFYYRTESGVILYASIFFLIYVATLGVQTQRASGLRQVFIGDARISRMLGPVSAAIALLTIMRVMSLDFAILWNNNQYLLIASTEGLAIDNPLFSFVRSISGVTMVVAGAFFACSILLRSWGAALLLGFSLLILGVISVAGASRTAAIPAAAVAVPLFLFGERRHKLLAALCAALSFLLIIIALVGRGIGTFGISNIPRYFEELFSYDGGLLVGAAVLNISQGMFVTTDSIYIGGHFAEIYKILSFSPLPSFLDGFNEIRNTYQIRLHRFVPMSALGEVYNFGWAWMAGFAIFMGFLFRSNARLNASRHPFIFIISSLIVFVSFMMANAYPMRNVFRQFLLAYALIYWPALWAALRRPLARTWPKLEIPCPIPSELGP